MLDYLRNLVVGKFADTSADTSAFIHAYIAGAKCSGFSVGDRVTVIRTSPSRFAGWDNV